MAPAHPRAVAGALLGLVVLIGAAYGAARIASRPPAQPAATVAAAPSKPAPATQADATSAAPWDRMVVRTAQLALQVTSVEEALGQVRQIAQAGGGFVSASNTRVEKAGDREQTVAELTIQVRSDALDSTIQALRQLAVKVESENGSSQDVTEEYVDLDSNLRNLQASEAAILKLMERAERIEDVVSLQRELTNVRGQIERLQGRKRYLERRSEMSTVSVMLRPPPPAGAQGWDPLGVARRGWQASLAVLRTVAEALIVATAFSWWLVPLVALGVYLWLTRRGRRPAAPPPAAQP